ncbi:MAG: hypothetical protein ACP5OA_04150 [Candidatus Woesearchaeota archaeon]
MTIIVGTRYAQGIIVGYDTVSLYPKGDKYRMSGYIEKFRSIYANGHNLGVGLSDIVDEGYFFMIRDELNNNKDITKGINKFLRYNKLDSKEAKFVPNNITSFIFGDARGLRTATNAEDHVGFRQDYAGIGRGYYPAIAEFMRKNHNPKSGFDDALVLIKNALELSKIENRKDPEYIKGNIIKGMGIGRMTDNNYELLEVSNK